MRCQAQNGSDAAETSGRGPRPAQSVGRTLAVEWFSSATV